MTLNIKDETLGHVPYIHNKCLKTRKVKRICNEPCDYIHTGRSGKQEVTLELSLDIEGALDSTSHDITKAARRHGLGDTL